MLEEWPTIGAGRREIPLQRKPFISSRKDAGFRTQGEKKTALRQRTTSFLLLQRTAGSLLKRGRTSCSERGERRLKEIRRQTTLAVRDFVKEQHPLHAEKKRKST